jgi:hypothetical protein
MPSNVVICKYLAMDEYQNAILSKAVNCDVELEVKSSSYTEDSMLPTSVGTPFTF